MKTKLLQSSIEVLIDYVLDHPYHPRRGERLEVLRSLESSIHADTLLEGYSDARDDLIGIETLLDPTQPARRSAGTTET